MLIGAVVLVVSMLMPLVSAKLSYRVIIYENPELKYRETPSGLTYAEMQDMSMLKLARESIGLIRTEADNKYPDLGLVAKNTVSVTLIVMFAIFSLLTTIFSALKNPVAAIVFDALAFAAFLLRILMFITSTRYNCGIDAATIILGAAVVILGGILTMNAKPVNAIR